MKKTKGIVIGGGIIVVISTGIILFLYLYGSKHSPAGVAKFSNTDISVRIDYHRPYKRGRKIFGGLVPYDKYWRTGANDATEINFDVDVIFGEKIVSKGRYRLYTIPHKNYWEIILNEELGQWGSDKPNKSLDVAKLETPVIKNDFKEQFTIDIQSIKSGVKIKFMWDSIKVEMPLLIAGND